MKLFIDTANINEIKEANAMGVLDGVTTNPTLVSKTGKNFLTVMKEILREIPDRPVSLETTSLDAKGMVEEGRKLAEFGENVVVKIPSTVEGLKACKALTELGLKTNCTLCFSSNQAMLVAKAGATYVSPFVGRLDDISEDGMSLIADIVQIYNNYDFETNILVASIRNPIHIQKAALLGADVCTIPFNVVQQLMQHPLTESGIERFLKDWEKVPR
ncbi:MAG: fructose-6-phosphate aldolase [Deltaproteobacteria bacterium RIFCSPLOWO2_02_FULL_44_10]|nr:MAG: fructose-6-phosphate aldolase [Deltaproteobacteria bacterium RIFCSPHIGHO2_02_FULL_44_16]OGQ45234.1 MAG: fructose-6-phosphate aldolase [Deltaproteobacteria bacterium RIFCSPLOWO2_02_FULL_44_10]